MQNRALNRRSATLLRAVSAHPAPLLEWLESRRLLSAGQLDPSFGSGGIVKASVNIADATTNDVDIQSDGKVVIAYTPLNGGLGVERFNANGTVDTSFGNKGVALVTTASSDTAQSVLVQS